MTSNFLQSPKVVTWAPGTPLPLSSSQSSRRSLSESSSEDDEDCQRWLANPLVNPETNRKIKATGKVYEAWRRRCQPDWQPETAHAALERKCNEWHANRLRNPDTGRAIKATGKIYKDWLRKCSGSPVAGQQSSCDRWLNNKLQDPETGKTLNRGAQDYYRWKGQCEPDVLKEQCARWLTEPEMNPETRRRIGRDGKISQAWAKACQGQPRVPEVADGPLEQSFKMGVQQGRRQSILKELRESWTDKRIVDFQKVRLNLQELNIPPWEYCVSTPSRFLDILNNVTRLGEGSFGHVFLGYIKGVPVAIKEAKLTIKERNNLMKGSKPNPKFFPEENLILDQTNTFVLRKMSPNFVLQYHVAMCQRCKVQTIEKPVQGTCSTTFLEPAKGSLMLLRRTDDLGLHKSILFQMLLAVGLLHRKLQIIHADIKAENILVKETPELKGTLMKYITPSGTFLIPNEGVVIFLADFNATYGVGPGNKDKDYGVRPVRVYQARDGSLKLEPLIAKFNGDPTDREATRPFFFMNNQGERIQGTQNRMKKDPSGSRMQLSNPIDLSDPLQYPATNFATDIQDSMGTFVGWDRFAQKGGHHGFPNLNFTFKDQLSKQRFVPHQMVYGPMSLDTGVKHLLAEEMLKTLYSPVKDLSKVKISETFDSL